MELDLCRLCRWTKRACRKFSNNLKWACATVFSSLNAFIAFFFFRPYVSRLWRDMKSVYTSLWTICRSCLMLLGCGLLPAPLTAANVSLEMEAVNMDQRPASRASQNSNKSRSAFCQGNRGDANFKASWQKYVNPPTLYSQKVSPRTDHTVQVGDLLVEHVTRKIIVNLYSFELLIKNDLRHTLKSASDI